METFLIDFLNTLKDKAVELLTNYGLKIIIALILYVVGFRVIKLIVKIINAAFKKSKMDISLSKFLISLIRSGLKVTLVFMIVAQLTDITPILAVGAAAGIGVGMALQGSLANLTGGVLILMLRPFSVGDYISETAFGNEGVVEDIQVFYTTLTTKDNKTVVIPNGPLANNSVTNFTKEKYRRVDLVFTADYEADAVKVKDALKQVALKHELVLKDRDIVTNMEAHGDSGVAYNLWAWCESCNYIKVKYDLIEQVKHKFDELDIVIPYPHMDVNITSMPLN